MKLNGTEKQVKWATEIREEKVSLVEKFLDANSLVSDKRAAIAALLSETDSRFWIDNKDTPSWALAAYAARKSHQHRWDEKRSVQLNQGSLTATRFPKGVGVKDSLNIYVIFNVETGNVRLSKEDRRNSDDEFSIKLIRVLADGAFLKEFKFLAIRNLNGNLKAAPVYRSSF